MYEIKKSIGEGFSGQPGGLYDILKQLQTLSAGIAGEVFFVDQYAGSDGGDGKSWEKAFKTIKYASTVSDAVIAGGGGKGEWRNTIFCRGRFTEDLTDFGEKVDYIGVGSMDARSRCQLAGHHTATSVSGVRFFNFEFMPNSAAPIFIWTTSYGVEFHDCYFTNAATWNTTYALEFTGTACAEIVIANCVFRPDATSDIDPFETAAIYIHCSWIQGCIIRDNLISGDIGIDIDTAEIQQGGYIINNIINSAGLCIDDESDDFVIAGNLMASKDSNSSSAVDCDSPWIVGNIVTGTDKTKTFPETVVTNS